MKCLICGHIFTESDVGYVKGSISGEVIELLKKGLKPTGQFLEHKGIIFCTFHFEEIPKYIVENLKTNAATRKG